MTGSIGPRPGRSGLRWAVFAVAVAVQLVVLYLPRAPGTGGIPGLDKVVHALVFALVAVTARRAGLPVRWVAVALIGHAVLSEVLQARLLPARSGDPTDTLADSVGVLVGLWPAARSRRRGA